MHVCLGNLRAGWKSKLASAPVQRAHGKGMMLKWVASLWLGRGIPFDWHWECREKWRGSGEQTAASMLRPPRRLRAISVDTCSVQGSVGSRWAQSGLAARCSWAGLHGSSCSPGGNASALSGARPSTWSRPSQAHMSPCPCSPGAGAGTCQTCGLSPGPGTAASCPYSLLPSPTGRKLL